MQETACNTGNPGLIPVSGRSPGEGNGNPLQYSCMENPMNRGAWQATVHGVAKVRHDLATKPLPPNHKPFLSPEEYNWIQSLCNITDCRVFAIQSYSTYKELGCCEPSSRENTVNRLSSCNDSGVGWSDKHFKANGVTVFSDIKEKTLLVNRNIFYPSAEISYVSVH